MEDETKESARGKELPMIHYSYPDNSNKWGGGRRQSNRKEGKDK